MSISLREPNFRNAAARSLFSVFAMALLLLCVAAQPAMAQDGGVDGLIRDVNLENQARTGAAIQAVNAAEKLINELRYIEAEEKLQEAVRLDPGNQGARELLDTVLMLLSDRSGDIRDLQRRMVDEKKVRLQQDVFELERLYLDGRRAMDEGSYDKAIAVFDQILERIRWFPFDYDLSDQQNRARQSKEESIRLQNEYAATEKREREMRILAEAESEMARSVSFIQNRIDEILRQARRLFAERDYERVITLCDEVLLLDPSRKDVRALRREAAELRHLYEVLDTGLQTQLEWDRTFLSQLESEIPYTDIFNFPTREEWLRISRQEQSLEERLQSVESQQAKTIRSRLKVRVASVEFEDEPFEQVIQFLRELSGINFVLTKEASEALEGGDGTVRLAEVTDLPLENVLNLVLQGNDPPFTYVIRSGAVLIGPSDSVRNDVFLEFYEVSDITKDKPDFRAPRLALESSQDGDDGGAGGLFDIGGEEDSQETTLDSDILVELVVNALFGDEGEPDGESVKVQSGRLVANTTLANHRKLVQLLKALRKSTGVMVTVESRFIDLQDNFLESIGVDYGNPFNSNLPNPINDIDGAGTQIASGFEIVDAQGEIDVRAAVYNAFSLPLGSSVSPFNLSDTGGFALQYNVLDSYALEAILEANQKMQRTKKLDAPRVTAFNTQISHSLVVDQSAYIEDAEVNQTGVVPVINPVIGILNSGSILQVRPTVSHDRKYVILEIEPTLAVQLPSRFKTLTLGLTNLNVEFPVLSVTNIKTTVTIPDGGTVLVGGLKRTITQESRSGIPVLSRLPILDLLAGRKGNARMQSNLFVLISAKITVIRDEEEKRFN
jgi:tetratricopeptide (TPR) repeat protein